MDLHTPSPLTFSMHQQKKLQPLKKFKLKAYFNGGKVHRLFDNFVIIVQPQTLHVDWIIKRPRICLMLLTKKILHDR